jgi:chromosomal replication initiator protein
MNTNNMTFESYVPGPASACAYRLCQAVARSAPSAPPVLVLHGPTGTGKTHLLDATAETFRARNPNRRVVVTTAHEFRHALVAAIRLDRVRDFGEAYIDVALLVVDDLHVLADRPGTQDGLARSLASCVAAGVRVIGAATAPLRALAVFRSILEQQSRAPVRQCRVNPPSRREMRAIAATLASGRSIIISSSMLNRVARRSRGDVRRALGALTHVEAMSVLPGARPAPAWMAEPANTAG